MYKREGQDRKATYPHQWVRSLQEVNRLKRLMLGLPIRREGNFSPYGYILPEDDQEYFLPDEEIFGALLTVRYKIEDEHMSLRDAAMWVTEVTGVPVSASGINFIMKCRPPVEECLLPINERIKLLYDGQE